MSEVLTTVSDFSGFFFQNHFLEGGFTFQGGGGRGLFLGLPIGGISFDGWG